MARVLLRWATPTAPAATAGWLTGAERARLDALRTEAARAGFRSAHALVRIVAAEVLGVDPPTLRLEQRCPACGGPHGPPGFTGPGAPYVSFAHTDGLVVAAAADLPVGVDAEPATAAALDVADVALSATEQLQLAALALSEQPAALTRWWVRKEAVLKALDLGLTVGADELEVTPPGQVPAVVRWPASVIGGPMTILDLDHGATHVGALAVRTDDPVELDAAPLATWP